MIHILRDILKSIPGNYDPPYSISRNKVHEKKTIVDGLSTKYRILYKMSVDMRLLHFRRYLKDFYVKHFFRSGNLTYTVG